MTGLGELVVKTLVALVVFGSNLLLGSVLLAEPVAANPFDPSGFISSKAVETAVEANTLSGRANYRLDGQRYQRFDVGDDAVYFPLVGDKPEVREELALCPGHLSMFAEVLLIRDKLPIDANIKKQEASIVAIGHKCREAKLASPPRRESGPEVDVKVKPFVAGKERQVSKESAVGIEARRGDK
jgi:hypothetical protein